MLRAWLIGLLGGTLLPPDEDCGCQDDPITTPSGDESLALVALRARIVALENEQADVLVAWAETRQSWVRFLKRQGAVRSREPKDLDLGEPVEEEEEEDPDQLSIGELMRMKTGVRDA